MSIYLVGLLGALGAGGVIGTVITTYGGKSRERRHARSDVIACLLPIEIERRSKPVGEGLQFDEVDFAALEVKCMIAGVPRDHALHLQRCEIDFVKLESFSDRLTAAFYLYRQQTGDHVRSGVPALA